MFRQTVAVGLLAGALVLLVGCGSQQRTSTPAANIVNPASAYCDQNGGKIEFKQDATGGTVGICKFPDATECEEWAFYRGECKPGDKSSAPVGSPVPTRTVPASSENGEGS